jgi:tetratricopeptide (TPR) repeat protein
MTGTSDPREKLTRRLLEIHEPAASGRPLGPHPNEESLAQFCDGALSGSERDAVVEHVADCAVCRGIVAAVLRASDEQPAPTAAVRPRRSAAWFANSRTMLAAAAALLLVVTAWLLLTPGRMTEQIAYRDAKNALVAGNFRRVESLVDQAGHDGLKSARLLSLAAQAKRQMTDPIALATAGRLTDFGIDVGGVVARDPTDLPHRAGLDAAEQLLAEAGEEELEVVLNRGHLLLSRQKPMEALAEFRAAQARAAAEAMVWLGSGIAKFMLDDFAGAEQDFREAALRDSGLSAAKINLAMALEEQGKTAEAIAAWQEVLQGDVEAGLRRKIELNLERLKQEQGNG